MGRSAHRSHPCYMVTKYLHQNLEEESQGLESSHDHVIKESIACRSEPADSDAKTGIGFLQIALADNDKGYDSAPGQNMLDSRKRERLESKLS